jgi:hypothetical protein
MASGGLAFDFDIPGYDADGFSGWQQEDDAAPFQARESDACEDVPAEWLSKMREGHTGEGLLRGAAAGDDAAAIAEGDEEDEAEEEQPEWGGLAEGGAAEKEHDEEEEEETPRTDENSSAALNVPPRRSPQGKAASPVRAAAAPPSSAPAAGGEYVVHEYVVDEYVASASNSSAALNVPPRRSPQGKAASPVRAAAAPPSSAPAAGGEYVVDEYVASASGALQAVVLAAMERRRSAGSQPSGTAVTAKSATGKPWSAKASANASAKPVARAAAVKAAAKSAAGAAKASVAAKPSAAATPGAAAKPSAAAKPDAAAKPAALVRPSPAPAPAPALPPVSAGAPLPRSKSLFKLKASSPGVGGAAVSGPSARQVSLPSALARKAPKAPPGMWSPPAPAPSAAMTSLTQPQTPLLVTSTRPARPAPPSSTTLELERAEKERLAMQRKRQQSLQLAKLAAQHQPVAVKKPLTKPETPALVSRARPGAARAAQLVEAKQRDEQAHALAQQQQQQQQQQRQRHAASSGPIRATHPEPFKLATQLRVPEADKEEESSPYRPLALQVARFQSKTPARFHTVKAGAKAALPPAVEPKLTEPESPQFATDARLRGPEEPSAAEREQRLLESRKPFKARPLSRKVLDSTGELGVPKVEKRAPCVPVGFVSHTEGRAAVRRPMTPTLGGARRDDGKGGAAALRRPNSAGHGHGHPHGGPPKLTEVRPFAMATEARAAMRPAPAPEPEPAVVAAPPARPMPDFSKAPKLPKADKKAPVQPQPFALEGDKRHEEAQRKLQEQVHKELAEARRLREFKARPISGTEYVPPSSPPNLRPLTDPKTPAVLRRSLESKAAFQQQQQDRERAESDLRAFHARPVPGTTFAKDFSPELPHRTTGSLEVSLATDSRAAERAAFEAHVKDRLRQEEQEAERLRLRREADDQAKLKELRRSLVHKAQPVPDYAALAAQGFPQGRRSPKRLTHPESPFLVTKQRAAAQPDADA